MERRINVCVELKDALTNRRLEQGELLIRINGFSPLAKKEDGYYVFPEIKEEELEIKAAGIGYAERSCRLSLADFWETKKVTVLPGLLLDNRAGFLLISVRLCPDERYILPAGYKRIMLTGEPMEEIPIIGNGENPYLLAADYQGGEIMEILFPERIEAAGMQLRISEKDGRRQEDFTIVEAGKPFQYRISGKLEGNYSRGSRIYEWYSVQADEQGKAYAVVKE
ncbi:MAG: hypothetical protein NC300_04185 [Bacteroidales bacterium]|nr:hypothetical protein [Clostridium sp.]MCM1203321.1 hypothetical protein [Bacteroidales bacterium]